MLVVRSESFLEFFDEFRGDRFFDVDSRRSHTDLRDILIRGSSKREEGGDEPDRNSTEY